MKIVKLSFWSCIYFTSFGSAEPGDLLEYNYQSTFSISTIQFILNSLGNDPSLPMYNISVYDINGRFIEQLKNDIVNIGSHSLIWNAHSHARGIYFVHLTTEKDQLSQKLILVK